LNQKFKKKLISLLVCLTFLVGTLTGCTISNDSTSTASDTNDEVSELTDTKSNTRSNTEKELNSLKAKYDQNPDDTENTIQYAQSFYKLAEFDQAKKVLKPLINAEEVSPEVLHLMADIEYISGNYEQAEKYYTSLSSYSEYSEVAQYGLMMVYYQQNEYGKAKDLQIGEQGQVFQSIMTAFNDEQPYQIDWNGLQQAVIPFKFTDPLPVVPIEINSQEVNVIIDTGAAEFMIDDQLAAELGVEPLVTDLEGVGGGGATNDTISYGIIESIVLGGVTIKNIPVSIVSTDQYSGLYQEESFTISGILGIKLMQQFLSTMNYPKGQLELHPRTKENGGIAADTQTEVLPFQFIDDHFMVSKLTVNEKKNLNFFFDSGLDDDGDLLLPAETLDYLDIPIPEVKTTNEIGGLGGSYSYGEFAVDSLELGTFQNNNLTGLYGIFPEVLYYEMMQLYVDGLISHDYLKQYKWTIDFDAMEMAFSK